MLKYFQHRSPGSGWMRLLARGGIAGAMGILGATLLVAPAWAQFTLDSADDSDPTTIVATFSDNVDPTTGEAINNYQVFETDTPLNRLTISVASVIGADVTITVVESMVDGTNYTLRAQSVQSTGGSTIPAGSTATFMAGTGPAVTPIADIQNDLGSFLGTIVTVEAVVYIPTDYRQNASFSNWSGYVQDTSDRGINIFGFDGDNFAADPALQTVGNLVRITGEVGQFDTTVELLNLSNVTLVQSGDPVPPAQLLSTAAANSSSWEGTYIEVTGSVQSSAVGGPGLNYTVNDGTGDFVVRVVDALGIPPFANGTTITGRGAGGAFMGEFQLDVGNTTDVFESGDTQGPSVVGANATATTSVVVQFNEVLEQTGAETTGNYQVFETANSSNTVAVTAAALNVAAVTLTLGSALPEGVGYTVLVSNVTDVSGNPIGANNSATFTYQAVTVTPIADIQTNLQTFLGTVVTIEAVVYIPSTYRQDPAFSNFSGYVQDNSGRGVNIFGFDDNVAAADPALQAVGNLCRITGTVAQFNTTVEIEDLTEVVLLQSGAPVPPAAQLSVSEANSSSWEGTYIEVTATVLTSALGGPGRNYTVDDGSGTMDVRVVNTLGVSTIPNGSTITARGAGGEFQGIFQVGVGNAFDIIEQGASLRVASATAASATSVAVDFNLEVTAATAEVPTNYSVFETNSPTVSVPVSTATLSGDRLTVTLGLGAPLTDGTQYTVQVQNVQDDGGNTIPPGPDAQANFLFSTSGVTPIAAIQENINAFVGQEVTIEAIVYIPTTYRQSVDFNNFSGYVQDGSGRGINVFAFDDNPAGSDPALQTIGNLVRITGTISQFQTTVEIGPDLTQVTLLQSGLPRPPPAQISAAVANSAQWEGTFIEVAGEILSSTVSGPGLTYVVTDGTGNIDVRVVDSINALQFSPGQIITARGAGGFFNQFQVNVGVDTDIFEGTAPDNTPPRILRASLTAPNQVTINWDETVENSSATDPTNYTVFRTNVPTTTAGVVSASKTEPDVVVLQLDQDIQLEENWSLNGVNVRDEAGNAIPAPGQTVLIERSLTDELGITGPPFTFLPREGEEYPISINVPLDVVGGQGQIILRIFDSIGNLKRTLYDSRVTTANLVFSDNTAVIPWDGKDDLQSFVQSGAYIAHLLVNGTVEGSQTAQMPVVVAIRLDQ